MAKILVVDDRTINRQFLADLLGYAGYAVVEAADGHEALQLLRTERPDLTICDILMPRMDGYDFVRSVRADPQLANANIIFYTATYVQAEARTLAEKTGVRHVITKPAEPEDILRLVAESLKETGTAEPDLLEERYRADHVQLLTDTLISRTEELEAASGQLAALVELGLELSSARDADRMLQTFNAAARRLVPSSYAVAAVLNPAREKISWLHADGARGREVLPTWYERNGVLDRLLESKKPLRLSGIGGDATSIGFSSGHPPVHSFLGIPLVMGSDAFGWVYLVDRAGLDAFTAEDERLLSTPAAQLAINFTNLRLSAEIRSHAARLEREVAERRRAEAELRASEQRTRLATETAAIGIWEWNVRSGGIRWDAQMFRIYGLEPTPDGMVTYADWSGAVVPEELPEQERILQETVQNRGRSTRRFSIRRRSDGAVRIILAMETVRLDGDGEVEWVVGTNHDITEASEAEHRIRHLAEQNRLLLDSAGEGIYGIDRQGRITFANPAACRMLGASAEEVLGQPAHELFHHTRANGLPFPREECRVKAAFTDGLTDRVDDEVFWRSDGTSFPVEYSSVPIRDGEGQVVGAVVTFNDISERLRRQEELEQERRVSTLGRLAATVSHEFNNVLMGITPNAEAIRRTAGEPSLVQAAERILKSVERGKNITRDILRYTRPEEPAFAPLEIGPWLEEMAPEIRGLAGDGVTVQFEHDAAGARVFADATMLAQALTNLVTNARDAMKGKGTLTVRTETEDGAVRLKVSDTGCGIPADVVARVFDPLFTSKKGGTGLGLSVVSNVVRKHGGAVSVESRPGEGTTFVVELPVYQEGK